MMRQALVALGPRTVLPVLLVGGAALALGALFVPRAESDAGLYQLVLHAPEAPNSFYLSAWADGGPVLTAHDGSDHQAIVFTRRGDEHDGCSWLGTERLVPLAPGVYHYSYRETLLACSPDARPFRKTPRDGIVTVERYQGAGAPTALNAVQPPANAWNEVADDDDDDFAEDQFDDDVQAEINAALQEAEQAVRDANQQIADELAAAQQAAADDDE